MTIILDGKKVRDLIAERLKKDIQELGITPKVAILQVGNLEESNAYIRQKKLFAEKIGVVVHHQQFPLTVTEDILISEIERLNKDKSTHGIILQLPIPADLDKHKIIDTIHPTKDIDGLTAANVKRLWAKQDEAVIPATARGVITLLKHFDIELDGKKVVIVGRSILVGKPLALAFLSENATVTICHRHTKNLEEETRHADVLVVAAGTPNLIGKHHVKEGQVVVDVGINMVDGTKLENEMPKKIMVGDVKFEDVKNIVTAISPVPGGIGPMTVASLFENLLDATKRLQ